MASEQIQQLRERVDDLAMRVLLAGAAGAPAGAAGGDQLSPDLAWIGETALAAGYHQTASAARVLVQAGSSLEALRDGITRLQQALEEDCRQVSSPPTSNPLAQDPELLADFVVETREHLASIESQCLALEQDRNKVDAIHSVFRGFHTIKGLAGFLDLPATQQAAHEVETLLDLARNGKLVITPDVIDVILAGADYLSRSVAAVEAHLAGARLEPVPPDAVLLERIRAVPAAMTSPTPPESSREETPATPAARSAQSGDEPAPAAPPAAPERPGRPADTFSVRVDTSKLDYLMDMVGEMVIAQSLIRHDPLLTGVTDPKLLRNLSQLTRVTTEVQRTAMAMRMIPVGQLFQRMARLVRDLSRKSGKQVEMEMAGEDTEVDKTIAEELADPLMHMLRNAIDHGIETPEERAAAGKSAAARVRLAAYHQGGQIVVEIADDGRGLDSDKIMKKAIARGLVGQDENLSEAETFNLIFEPGFSTAEKITDVSGRGVGMDVVRKHVQKLRGRIDVESHRGLGTRFLLKLPLTLAIIDGLVVAVGETRYIVPIYSVREIFRPTAEIISTAQGRGEMALVHDRLLPVVRFYRRFKVRPRHEDPCDGLLIVSESDGKQFCLLVDELLVRQEVVIKSLGEAFKAVSGVAGGTILGDGRVGLILDMDAIFDGRAHD